MRQLDPFRRLVSRIAAKIRSAGVWSHVPMHADKANRSPHLDDVFYIALLGPHV